jgi:hypothetical protein
VWRRLPWLDRRRAASALGRRWLAGDDLAGVNGDVAADNPWTLGAGAAPAGLGKKGPELELVFFFFVVGGAGVVVLVGGVG